MPTWHSSLSFYFIIFFLLMLLPLFMSTLDSGVIYDTIIEPICWSVAREYYPDTLVKNPLTPIVLSISNTLGLKYNFFFTNLYFLSIFGLLLSLRNYLSPILSIFLVVLLIFTPENFSQY